MSDIVDAIETLEDQHATMRQMLGEILNTVLSRPQNYPAQFVGWCEQWDHKKRDLLGEPPRHCPTPPSRGRRRHEQ